jgi:nicotinamide-nucleotide amidase
MLIQETIGKLLRKKKLTVSAAESCTGGLIASMLTDVPGSSDYFISGIIAYADEAKIKFLGVKKQTLKKYGAVSSHTAKEMARGVRNRSHSDIGISTTGIAGPSGGSRKKPVGTIWIGYSDKNVTFAEKFVFGKNRLKNKKLMSKMALDLLLKQVRK